MENKQDIIIGLIQSRDELIKTAVSQNVDHMGKPSKPQHWNLLIEQINITNDLIKSILVLDN